MLSPVAAAHPRQVFDHLAQRRLLVVSGKGGVGRTTVAALLGLALAARGRRVLVATTGLDHRLAWMVGAPGLESTPQAAGPNMWIQRLVPHECIREYGELVIKSAKLAHTVFDNRVVRRLMRAVPGLDDFAVLGKVWHEAFRADHFDVVIFDGPATGHLRYLLGVPQAILRAVQHGPLTGEAREIHQALCDGSQTEAVLVGLPELWPLTELTELALALRRDIGMTVGTVMVNAMWSPSFPLVDLPDASADPSGDVGALLQRTNQVARMGREQYEALARWLASDAAMDRGPSALVTIPWLYGGIRGQADLGRLVERLENNHIDDVAERQSESA